MKTKKLFSLVVLLSSLVLFQNVGYSMKLWEKFKEGASKVFSRERKPAPADVKKPNGAIEIMPEQTHIPRAIASTPTIQRKASYESVLAKSDSKSVVSSPSHSPVQRPLSPELLSSASTSPRKLTSSNSSVSLTSGSSTTRSLVNDTLPVLTNKPKVNVPSLALGTRTAEEQTPRGAREINLVYEAMRQTKKGHLIPTASSEARNAALETARKKPTVVTAGFKKPQPTKAEAPTFMSRESKRVKIMPAAETSRASQTQRTARGPARTHEQARAHTVASSVRGKTSAKAKQAVEAANSTRKGNITARKAVEAANSTREGNITARKAVEAANSTREGNITARKIEP